jgi:hypothetical protein
MGGFFAIGAVQLIYPSIPVKHGIVDAEDRCGSIAGTGFR